MSKTYRKKLVRFYNNEKCKLQSKVIIHQETGNNKFYDYSLFYPQDIKMKKSKNISGLVSPYHKNGDLDCFDLYFCKHAKLLKRERNKTKQDLNQVFKYQNIDDFDDSLLINKKRFKCKTQPSLYKFPDGRSCSVGFLDKY